MLKTNAMRLLEARKIPYEARVYADAGEFHTAAEAAQLIGAPVETVYKTLVVLRETPRAKPLLVMIASDREIDLRRLARSMGDKKLRMATKKEAERLTGAQIGGISALAQLNRGFEMCLDKPALAFESVHVSGGVRGLDLELRVADLLKVTNARVVAATGEGEGTTE
jgi:Cys-tRNA(Pro)/Cys-tRNA(Cys) deacylase